MGDREPKPPADGTTDHEAERVRMPLRPPSIDDLDEPPPPPRPAMSDAAPPPVLRKIPMPRPVRLTRSLWLASFAATGAGVLVAFLSRTSLVAELDETLGRLAPGYDESEVASLVNVVYWGSIAGLAAVIVLEAVVLGALLNRRGGARWLQVPVLGLHAVAVLVATAFLGIGDWGLLVDSVLLAGFGLAFIGWVLGLVPAARRWFRMPHESQLPASD